MSTRYDLIDPTYGAEYRVLVDALAGISYYCSLVVRDFDEANPEVSHFLERVRPYENDVRRVSEWPGTRLTLGGVAELHLYALTPNLVSVLKGEVGSLFAWLTPTLPEDLCFYRKDKSCVLATISHERDAYLDLTDQELLHLQVSVPTLRVSPSP